jgi:hypothetical protein
MIAGGLLLSLSLPCLVRSLYVSALVGIAAIVAVVALAALTNPYQRGIVLANVCVNLFCSVILNGWRSAAIFMSPMYIRA